MPIIITSSSRRSGRRALLFFIVTKDKKEKWVEQSAVLLMQKNKPTGFHCIIKDISEKKQMQLELEQYEFKAEGKPALAAVHPGQYHIHSLCKGPGGQVRDGE